MRTSSQLLPSFCWVCFTSWPEVWVPYVQQQLWVTMQGYFNSVAMCNTTLPAPHGFLCVFISCKWSRDCIPLVGRLQHVPLGWHSWSLKHQRQLAVDKGEARWGVPQGKHNHRSQHYQGLENWTPSPVKGVLRRPATFPCPRVPGHGNLKQK